MRRSAGITGPKSATIMSKQRNEVKLDMGNEGGLSMFFVVVMREENDIYLYTKYIIYICNDSVLQSWSVTQLLRSASTRSAVKTSGMLTLRPLVHVHHVTLCNGSL